MKAIRAPARGSPVGKGDGGEDEDEAVEIGGALDGPQFVEGKSLRKGPPPRLCGSRATLFRWRTTSKTTGSRASSVRLAPPYKPSALRMSGNERCRSRRK
jgi:hypothetical protein